MSQAGDAKSFTDLISTLTGTNWERVGAWVGPVVAAMWLYGSISFQEDSNLLWKWGPVTWVIKVLRDLFGYSPEFVSVFAAWLHQHPGIYPVILGVAVLFTSAGSRAGGGAVYSSLGALFLLLALEVRLAGSTVLWLLGTCLVLTAIAIAVDLALKSREVDGNSIYFSYPSASIQRLFNGPLYVVLMPILLPLVIFTFAVNCYRVKKPEQNSAFSLDSAINAIPNGTLSDAPARKIVRALAAAEIAARDEKNRSTASFLISQQDRRAGYTSIT